jgi:flagellar basal body-associated protein FliL
MPETYDAHKSTTEVRQGNRRQMNLRVLIISIILIVAAFAAIYVFFLGAPPSNTVSPYTP